MVRLAKCLLITLSLWFCRWYSGARAQDSLWSCNYGGYSNDFGSAVIETGSGDFLLLGSTYSYGSGDYDIYLIKIDSAGNEIWSRTYGGPGSDYGNDITATADGGYIITGSTTSYGSGGHDLYLLKVSGSGSLVWSQTYGGTEDDIGSSVRMTVDSGFVVCGTTSSFGSNTDMYLIRIDSIGDSLWSKTYGGSAGETGAGVRLGADSGFVLIGSTGSYGDGYSSIFLVCTGDSGDTLWTASYGGSRADFGYGLEMTNDKGCILVGATAPDGENFYDAILVKVDSLGGLEWDQTYGDVFEDRAYSVKTTADGGYIMAGVCDAGGIRKNDIYMVKTDAIGGVEWEDTYGGSESDAGRMVIIDRSGNYFLTGHSYSSGSGAADVYVLSIQGPVQSDVDNSETPLPVKSAALSQNYPNPFNPQTRIEFMLPRYAAYRLTIYNVMGQVIRRWNHPGAFPGWYTITWDGRDENDQRVASGIYFYRFESDRFAQTRKMILLK